MVNRGPRPSSKAIPFMNLTTKGPEFLNCYIDKNFLFGMFHSFGGLGLSTTFRECKGNDNEHVIIMIMISELLLLFFFFGGGGKYGVCLFSSLGSTSCPFCSGDLNLLRDHHANASRRTQPKSSGWVNPSEANAA